MNEIHKKIKKIKENELDNMNNLLIAMKNNCELKKNLKNFIEGTDNSSLLEIQKIKAYCDIIQNDVKWIENYNMSLLKNIHLIIEKYNSQITTLNKNIDTINDILQEKYQSDIISMFTLINTNSDAMIKKESEATWLSLFLIDNFLQKVSSIQITLDYGNYFNNEEALILRITDQYSRIKDIIEMKV